MLILIFELVSSGDLYCLNLKGKNYDPFPRIFGPSLWEAEQISFICSIMKAGARHHGTDARHCGRLEKQWRRPRHCPLQACNCWASTWESGYLGGRAHLFTGAAVTSSWELGDFVLLQSWRPEVQNQGCSRVVPCESCEGNIPQSSFSFCWLLATLNAPWLIHTSLPCHLCPHIGFPSMSLCLCISDLFLLSLKGAR